MRIFLGKGRETSRQQPVEREILKTDLCSPVPEVVGEEDLGELPRKDMERGLWKDVSQWEGPNRE